MTARPPGDPTADYLAALGSHLTADMSEETARRHIRRSSLTAGSALAARHSRLIRLWLLAPALAVLISTSGVAAAGGLPHRVQGMVADAAHLLPIPVPIPYPAPTTAAITQTPSSTEPTLPDAGIEPAVLPERPEKPSPTEIAPPPDTTATEGREPAADHDQSRQPEDTDRGQWDDNRSRDRDWQRDGSTDDDRDHHQEWDRDRRDRDHDDHRDDDRDRRDRDEASDRDRDGRDRGEDDRHDGRSERDRDGRDFEDHQKRHTDEDRG